MSKTSRKKKRIYVPTCGCRTIRDPEYIRMIRNNRRFIDDAMKSIFSHHARRIHNLAIVLASRKRKNGFENNQIEDLKRRIEEAKNHGKKNT